MVVLHNHYPVAICKPDYLGFMGVFLKDIYLGYPVGTQLEIELLGNEEDYMENESVSMVVSKSESNGTGLRLKNFKKDVVCRWQSVLSEVDVINRSYSCK